MLDNKRMNDLSYRSPKTEVRESPIHGKGLFAKQPIAAGEIVAVKGGHILTKQEWITLERQLGSAEIQISEELFIAPVGQEQRESCMLYTNHSCDPNIGHRSKKWVYFKINFNQSSLEVSTPAS
jgi:SET domain-containing protein